MSTQNESERLRLFFAIWPPEPAAAALHAWAVATQAAVGGRALAAANVHLTLAFLGHVPAERLDAAVAAARRVRGTRGSLPLTEARYWPRSHLVWVGPTAPPAPLVALAAELQRALAAADFTLDEREFVAHVTLLRDVPRLRGLPELPAVEWPIDEFVLARSAPAAAGSVYTILARFPLGYT
ncbi:MAG TPA: RNA 2',3'-cyclic phosphodiesterase [Gammaproteobacteria bacterium]|jgi:2'-5' RNA ligase